MRELTIEQKAQRYDEILDRAKKELNACGSQNCDAARQIFRLFPELKEESEGERIRNRLIEFISCNPGAISDLDEEKALSWLEKQGKSSEEIEYNPFDDFRNSDVEVDSNEDGFIAETIRYKDECKQGKQKPANNKPKFKEGEWIIIDGETMQIESVGDKAYNIKDEGIIPFRLENEMHLWTIQDAKDGDVLANGSNIFIFHFINDTRLMGYCHVNTDDGRFYDDIGKNECFCLIDAVVNPATKEQRDLLFQKMKEAGYEWSSEHRKLIKRE